MSYDTNLRLKLWPLQRARAITHATIPLCDVIFPSLEDATVLTGLEDPDAIADFYLGLGVPMIVRAFVDPALPEAAFAAKLAFTALTLGAGFLGGEVTPLFFIGATLGNVLARWLGLPIGLGAGVGLAAMFAVCSNTPLALSVMAVELLGSSVLPHVLIVSALAYVLAGHRGIYPAQRLSRDKSGALMPSLISLRELQRAPPRREQRDAPAPAQGGGGVGPGSS